MNGQPLGRQWQIDSSSAIAALIAIANTSTRQVITSGLLRSAGLAARAIAGLAVGLRLQSTRSWLRYRLELSALVGLLAHLAPCRMAKRG